MKVCIYTCIKYFRMHSGEFKAGTCCFISFVLEVLPRFSGILSQFGFAIGYKDSVCLYVYFICVCVYMDIYVCGSICVYAYAYIRFHVHWL